MKTIINNTLSSHIFYFCEGFRLPNKHLRVVITKRLGNTGLDYVLVSGAYPEILSWRNLNVVLHIYKYLY